jgi:predicted dienelactone hydrolase
MAVLPIRARGLTASRGPRVAAVLAATLLLGTLTGAARQPAPSYPVQAAFTPAGPYATTTGTVTDAGGTAIYDLFYPANYAALGFKSPIVTWGNGTNATPAQVSVLLSHLASYGFTVIASTLPNTGSGNEIDTAAHYLVTQNSAVGSVFRGHLG